MISIKPKWVAKILNGKKTIEIRKNKALANAIQKLIDENGYADIYVYCTKDNKTKLSSNSLQYYVVDNKDYKDYLGNWNGKVVFKFRCYKVEEVESRQYSIYQFPYTESLDSDDLLNKSCLLTKYFDDYLGYDKKGFAIHISDLEIFDKPKELNDFYRFGVDEWAKKHAGTKIGYVEFWNGIYDFRLTNAPQNYCYVEIGE